MSCAAALAAGACAPAGDDEPSPVAIAKLPADVLTALRAGEPRQLVLVLAAATGFPLLTGKTAQLERERLYQAFRERTVPGLVLSRVGNFAVDLPDADVLIQVSGRYGSRQEEAQRLGRVLRPKKDGRRARFYTLVSLRTCEEDFARHRQLFLTEQGYSYQIEVRS